MPPYDFQALVAALLRAMSYFVSWEAPPGPDKGIDILAHTDPLGTKAPRIKVQVKRRAEKVNVEALRSFMAVLGEQDVGIFVSAGGFTSEAETEARTQEKRKITLLYLEKLFDLWVQHYDKLSETDKRLLPLRPVWYLALQSKCLVSNLGSRNRPKGVARAYREASGNVTLVEMGPHLATERAGLVTLHLTDGAPELYPSKPATRLRPTRQPTIRE